MAIDTVTAFELVKPDGTIVNVTDESDHDLFFALRVSNQDVRFVAALKFMHQGWWKQFRACFTLSVLELYIPSHRELLPALR